MRLITADIIFTGHTLPILNGVIAVDETGTILEVLDTQAKEGHDFLNKRGLPAIEYFKGFICPGFVNAHCHLELSYLKNKLTEGKGLSQFIHEIISKRKEATHDEILNAINQAESEMIRNGIVAVGDICNTADTIEVKKKQKLIYHNFVEVFDIDPERAGEVFENGLKLAEEFAKSCGQDGVSVTPHAPYSVSPELLIKINTRSYEKNSLLSIHNQEALSENEMFKDGKGELFELMKNFGLPPGNNRWPTGFSPLASVLRHLPSCNKLMFVHNTFASKDDVKWANQNNPQVWWCLCPNANLFIENRLPDINMLAENVSPRIVLGTDSYASNYSLSILDELKTISLHYPNISLHEILQWAGKNGAGFFGLLNQLGTIAKGKKPGLNHLTSVDVRKQKLTAASGVQRIL